MPSDDGGGRLDLSQLMGRLSEWVVLQYHQVPKLANFQGTLDVLLE